MQCSRFDVFMFHDELDILECRLTELQDVPGLKHVLVEAGIDHQGHPKPFCFAENRERFSAWQDRIIHVMVPPEGLPSFTDNPDPWSREHSQREYARFGLTEAKPGDIVLHGDVDEIPRRWAARSDPEPHGTVVLLMRHHIFAVDWLHPEPFHGTVITRAKNVNSFTQLRYARNSAKRIEDAGWHLTCLGGPEAIREKLNRFCHLEMREMLERGIDESAFYERGLAWGPPPESALGGVVMDGVYVGDGSEWPRWIREGKAPDSWFRPRAEEEAD